jgi:thiamine pyrophosphate-dependent acetolactate synthase large subunit-like protein
VDVCVEELHNSVPAKVAIHADIGAFTRQLIQQLASEAWIFKVMNPWWGQLNSKSDRNKAFVMVSLFLVYLMTFY